MAQKMTSSWASCVVYVDCAIYSETTVPIFQKGTVLASGYQLDRQKLLEGRSLGASSQHE